MRAKIQHSEQSCMNGKDREDDTDNRAVWIELFMARVLCRASYRILEYSTDKV